MIKFVVIGIIIISASLGSIFFRSSGKVADNQSGAVAESASSQAPEGENIVTSSTAPAPAPTSCDKECQSYIDSKINALRDELTKLIQSQPAKTQTVIQQTTQATTQPKEIYINFGSGGSTIKTDWIDVAGTEIVFDTSNYPGAKAFYFQANLKSDAGDKFAFARIYDTTTKVGVQGSDIKFAGLTSTFTESGSLTFFSGKLTLKVQIKGLDINLATIENPKIKAVYN